MMVMFRNDGYVLEMNNDKLPDTHISCDIHVYQYSILRHQYTDDSKPSGGLGICSYLHGLLGNLLQI